MNTTNYSNNQTDIRLLAADDGDPKLLFFFDLTAPLARMLNIA